MKPQKRKAEGEEEKRGDVCRGFEKSGKERRKMTREEGGNEKGHLEKEESKEELGGAR